MSSRSGRGSRWRRRSRVRSRRGLAGFGLESDSAIGYLFQIEMTYKAFRRGLKIAEVPIIFYERRLGQSKMNWRVIWEAFWGVLKLRLGPTGRIGGVKAFWALTRKGLWPLISCRLTERR